MADPNLNIPPQIASALKSYGVDVPNVTVAYPQAFYDYLTYPSTGVAGTLTYFQRVPGANGVTEAQTNMKAVGEFPKPTNYLLTNLEVVFFSGVSPGAAANAGKTALDDYNAVMNGQATIQLKVNEQEYFFDSPLSTCPAAFGVGSSAAITTYDQTAATTLLAANPWPLGAIRSVSPLLLLSNYKFKVNVNFPVAIPTPSGVAGTLGVRMRGYFYRLAG